MRRQTHGDNKPGTGTERQATGGREEEGERDVSGRKRCLKTPGTLFEVFPFFIVYLSFGAG